MNEETRATRAAVQDASGPLALKLEVVQEALPPNCCNRRTCDRIADASVGFTL
jgi:hypothetical protein